MNVNWTNPLQPISKHFLVRDALFLPKWKRLANETDGLTEDSKNALIILFGKMDQVRDLLGVPVIVHCGFRSNKYNLLVCGAENSAHIARQILVDGKKYDIAAVDWHTLLEGKDDGERCDKARVIIEPHLQDLGLRLEDNPQGSPWLHTDSRPVPNGGNRVFKP